MFHYFHSHPLIVGCSILFTGFGAGFSFNQYFSDSFHKVESIEHGRLSQAVSTLQQEALSKDEAVQTLTSELSKARENILILRNTQGSSNLSCQDVSQKYSSLSADYSQLSGMYRTLQANNQKAQQNCNVLARIDSLQAHRRSLEDQLNSVIHDVFNPDPESKKREIQVLLSQNNEQLLNLQQNLSR